MISDEYDEALFDHLTVEFLDHGKRAVEFLRTAKQLLGMSLESLPRRSALDAKQLAHTPDYQRLRRTLLERGLL